MKEYLGFGIAGNFANHLEQAGESNDFANVESDEEGAPKGIFPFYVPRSNTFLGRYCIDNCRVILPENKDFNVQAEPEVGLECEVEYKEDGCIDKLIPKYFMAFDDTSIRNDKDARKISQKKNFSSASKGFGHKKIEIDKFEQGGICDNYSLSSFLIFDGKLNQYGENSPLTSYSYFYDKLITWTIKKLNTQVDHAVLENLHKIIQEAKNPKRIIIAIGATRYTHLGESRFLQEGDEVCVVVYDHTKYTNEQIAQKIEQGEFNIPHASVVRQKVLREGSL